MIMLSLDYFEIIRPFLFCFLLQTISSTVVNECLFELIIIDLF